MNKRFKTLSLALATAVVLGLTACSPQQDAKTEKEKATSVDPLSQVQGIVSTASQGNFKATKIFETDFGMHGVVLEDTKGSGQKQIAWTNAKGEVFVPGPIFDKDGKNITATFLTKEAGVAPEAEPMAPSAAADAILSSQMGFVAGKSGPIVTVFFEPYCGYCNKLFEDLKPRIDKGEIRVRFIMVAFLAPDSAERAAAINSASNPYAALTTWEKSKDKQSIKKVDVSDADKEKVMASNKLMNDAGQKGTPALLFCDKNKTVAVVGGYPSDTSGFLAGIGSEGHALCN